ncbi:MAG: molybdenum cofactor guanylyltransferase [Spirochaetales bacterium]|nr:molybdenum cofactor guanylyltransferase [Spirochaetales bacterium]
MSNLKALASDHVTAGILTGGGSRRFGQDKASYAYKGQSLLEWTAQGASLMTDDIYLLVKNRHSVSSFLSGGDAPGFKILEDQFSVPTPLNGIHSIIPHVKEWLLLLACDIPFFQEDILRLLWEKRSPDKAAVIRTEGRYQPFLGLYPVPVLKYWDEAFFAGNYHLQKILKAMPCTEIDEAALESAGISMKQIANINSPADLEGIA